jgi:protein SCO1/2
MRRKVFAGIAAVASIVAIVAIPARAQNARPGASYFPNVTLTTQDGTTVRFYDDLIKGKIVAINLIYTTCKYACPLETARLAQVQRVLGDRMGRDVFFYSITIDPANDTPAVLKEYAEKFRAGPGWLFLTGSPHDIDLISRKIGLYSPPNPSDPDGHAPNLLVGNEVTGQWMRNSSLDNPKFLARTIGDWLASWRGPTRGLKSYAEATPLTLDRGEYTFRNHCAACHTVGRGERLGPDLAGITNTRDRAWLARFIREPDKMLAAQDPIAKELAANYKTVRMPNLALTNEDVDAVIVYLEKQTSADPARVMIESYLRIQEVLSADTLTGVQQEARRIAAEATTLGASADKIRSAADALYASADVKAARAVFATLSDAIIAHAKSLNGTPGNDVNVAYCPMVRKYWLQKGTAIRNPYYGTSMLECGRIEPRLPGVPK